MDRTLWTLPFVGGRYVTAPRRVSRLARWLPSVAFYPKYFSIVGRAAWKAKRGRYDGADWSRSSLEVVRALESVGCRFDISGVEHIDRLAGPCVFAGNHMSTLETSVLPVVIQPARNVTFVVKKSLIDYPVFKHVMRSRDPVAVSQTNPREDLKTTLVEGVERLNRGTSIVVFPEGSRMRTFNAELFNTIAVKLAGRAGVPVVPLALLTDAWDLGRRFSDIGRIRPDRKIHMEFGPPLLVEGRGVDQQRALIDFISSRLARWQEEDGRGSLPG
jgi:1-acyl-sn-glycerol-3-phosphate acyltransferase